MKTCPTRAELEKLLAGPLPPAEQEVLERHMESCAGCRQLVEGLTDLRSFIPARPTGDADSTHLRRVIAQLIAEPEISLPVVPAEVVAAPTGRISFLAPTDRAGFLGRLGSYDIRRIIGSGGMGTVFEAFDPLLKRTVAIKVLSVLSAVRAEAKARFLREAQAAAALTHENIVTIHAVAEDDGVPFLVLQYVVGESLADRLRRERRLPLPELIRIGTQVARGLAAVHGKGLIHRDIKPANILLEEGTGRAKIADFGLVKVTGDEPLSEAGSVAGTPEFMSPEQATGQMVDARSDLYSLGVVLYAASTGVSPFRSEVTLVTLDRVRAAAPPPVQEVEPTLPDWFCEVVYRLMAKDPGERIQTAQELATLLENGQGGPSPTIHGAGQPTRRISPLAKPVRDRRHWLGLATSLVVLAGLVVALGIYLTRPENNRPEHRPEPKPGKKPEAGFVIAGRGNVWQDLADALAAAQRDDVIEVYGNGPYLAPPLSIEGKPLTIRAMAGAQPVFLAKAPSIRASQPFLQTDSELRLEGLTIHWSIDVPVGKTEADMLSRCVIVSNRGRVTLTHCRIVAGQLNACVGVSGRDLMLNHCHCTSDNGLGAFWRPTPGGRLTAENCVFEGRVGLSVMTAAEKSNPASATLSLTHNTFAVEKSIQFALFPGTKQPLDISTRGNIFDNTHHCAMLGLFRAKKAGAPNPDEMIDMVRSIAKWSDEGNLHRRRTDYIVAQRAAGFVSAEVNSVAGWLNLWNLPPAQSVESSIHFHKRASKLSAEPLRLERFEKESGPVPAKVGADPDRVGPGPAYHAK